MIDLRTIRTDVVGSLLRPAAVIEARKRFDEGKLDAAGLRAIEDDAVRAAVQLQESIGLDVITDGEMRRLNFQDSFGAAVEGFDATRQHAACLRPGVSKAARRCGAGRFRFRKKWAPRFRTGGRSSRGSKLARNVPLEEYEFVAGVAKTPAKVSLIGPDRISQRFDHQNSKAVYWHGCVHGRRGRGRARRLSERGRCRLPLRPHRRARIHGLRRRALDGPDARPRRRPAEKISRSLKAEARGHRELPGVTFGIHLCRGNQRSMWHREGATTRSPSGCSPNCRTTGSCWNTIVREPAVSRRYVSCPRARLPCWAWSAPRCRNWKPSTQLKRRIDEAAKSAARTACDQPAMRLRLRCGGQSDQPRRSEAQARDRGRDRAAGLGVIDCRVPLPIIRDITHHSGS